MTRDPRFDVLFEPIRIGPVTAKNRFYQVPHCNGMGSARANALVRLREIKAEGGWGVVCTEETSIEPDVDISPSVGLQLWDDGDLPLAAAIAAGIHRHGALAGVELMHYGPVAANRDSRGITMGPSCLPFPSRLDPIQPRAIDRADLRAIRESHRRAAKLAQRAGFDIIYVAAVHDATLPMHFLSRRHNDRSDEYGGPLENRVRLLRELIEDTKDAVGDRSAVAVRLAVDELLGPSGISCDGEGRDIVAMLAELPDLWDVNLSNWANDSQSSRFADEGFQEPYVRFVKSLTSKPVVGVGLFTSPDAMVSQIRRGVLDLIGAARPSIADPFLPRKIAEGRLDDIRECIGCNICVAAHRSSVSLRCTQNPTAGEEWRRDWHPEIIRRDSKGTVLIVGGGPTGLECALTLGRRGFDVTLAEASDEVGGRVTREARLPGLARWSRVRDYRLSQIRQQPNVAVYPSSTIDADYVLEAAPERVVIATGARWRRDGLGRSLRVAPPVSPGARILTPDDIFSGAIVTSPVVIYDDDHYYLGGVLAEKFRSEGHVTILVTPEAAPSAWTAWTLELGAIERRLKFLGIIIHRRHQLSSIADDSVRVTDLTTAREFALQAATTVLVTARVPRVELYATLDAIPEENRPFKSITRAGDCNAPGTIAAAVYAGHRVARELATAPYPALRERIRLER
ncbi:MAG: hypothetical protein FJX65_04175 [Alphaproteobacteria bacterium]|nr:hypothetical protein [Alphaproteobacteria bacterium]